jgi:glutaredoxin 3
LLSRAPVLALRDVAARVRVYLTRTCPYCIAATELLRARGIEFEPIGLDDHPDRFSFTESILPGHDTVPLILIDGEPVGGYTELAALDRSGELQRRLSG